MKKFFAIVLTSIALFLGCKEEPIDLSTLKLVVSPDTVYIADNEAYKDLFISVQPKYGIEYQITQLPTWLKVDSSLMKAKINGGINTIRLTPVKDGLEGIYYGEIDVISDLAGEASVPVVMSVSGHPKLGISTSQFDFGNTSTSQTFLLKNTGTGILSWRIDSLDAWVNVSPKIGNLLKNQQVVVAMTCSRAGLDMNTYSSSIKVKSNAENTYSNLAVSMEVPKISSFKLSKSQLVFGYSTDEKSFYIYNKGNAQMSWTSEKNPVVNLSLSNGTISKGDSVLVNVSINRTLMSNGDYNSKIYIINEENKRDSILLSYSKFEETKVMLNSNLVDAEFCRLTNKIFYVTTSPSNYLVMLDPETNVTTKVALNKTPTSVSVNAAGTKVMIGHNGMVTTVDVSTMSILKEWTIPCDALDVIITSKDWGYIFPVRDQWEAIYGIELENGTQHNSSDWMIYAGTVGRLHPSEKYIYGADNGVSPSDIEKYNIQNGTASMLYDSPYHGDYPMSGNLWFTEEGDRIFTRGKTILRCSEVKAEDMTYNGSLGVTNQIQSLFHSKTADRLFVLTYTYNWSSSVSDSELFVFNNSYLNYKGSYPLEKFMVNNQLYNAEGRFVFANADGTHVYVLTKAASSSGLLYDWAVQKINSTF